MAITVKYPNSKQFKQELDKNQLEYRYLFLGEEEGEKDKYINRIIGMAFADERERANATARFHMENDELLAAADFALSPSMFSSRRLCVMYDIDGLHAGKNLPAFNDLVRDLPDTTILVMTSRENRPPAFMKGDMLAGVKVVQFWRYFDADIHNYITLSMKRLGYAIDDRAVELLIDRTGNDIKKIDDAIEMLRFSGQVGPVTADTVQNCIDDLREASIFEFIDALFNRDRRSFTLFKKIFEDGTSDLKILYMITRQAEMIERYYFLADGGMAAEEAMRQAGVYSKNKEKFWRYTEKFPPRKLKKIFPLISSADYKLKSGSKPGELTSNPVFNLVSGILFNV